ncbi:WYL domain-containing protein [Aliiglaciecola sp. 2_MG-2023]|uniref:WYL domain-containing protein n=1 Tax=unclassified Aliiglaciecola TaxID=2593648 RepID=UPI0026E23DDC|nr:MULTISPECIES: WYL domain-containing protein [unclassified Aliiglaciecola]MDO6710347.1 WYL domain-containing protein [Aliiglaciecola sp. 2_MG-2023]MDO6751494.1 WYL domain-containing protein [Aliiglaciecola sp. 1_MG-2023]
MQNNKLKHVNFAQKRRLAFIDFLLLFRGAFSRSDLTNKFEMGMANATRDIALYRELAADNCEFDSLSKLYRQSKLFSPLFEHDARKTLIKLANNISDGYDAIGDIKFPVEAPSQLNVPDIFIVAHLVQAILNNRTVSLIYTSLSSGSASRELVPHSIVDNGLRWHIRAFDRKSSSFRDFVLTRISKVKLLEDKAPQQHEDKLEDHQWQRIMPLQLVSHPNNVQFSTAIEMDYGMRDGVLNLNVRAALAGYLLRRWNVDCTEDASLKGGEYQLWLRNQQTLYGAENLAIAPGYNKD